MAIRPSAAAYGLITRQVFDVAARRIRRRDRDRAYQWICDEQADGKVWWSIDHAVHAWTVHQMTQQAS